MSKFPLIHKEKSVPQFPEAILPGPVCRREEGSCSLQGVVRMKLQPCIGRRRQGRMTKKDHMELPYLRRARVAALPSFLPFRNESNEKPVEAPVRSSSDPVYRPPEMSCRWILVPNKPNSAMGVKKAIPLQRWRGGIPGPGSTSPTIQLSGAGNKKLNKEIGAGCFRKILFSA